MGDHQPVRGYSHRSEQLRQLVLGREPSSSPIVMPQPRRERMRVPPANPNAASAVAMQATMTVQSPDAAELGTAGNGPVFVPAPTR